MSKKNGSGNKGPNGEGPGDYKVGYGKPPTSTQFPKGKSGNPGGRPKQQKRDVPSAIQHVLDQPVVVRMPDGSFKKVTYVDALILSIFQSALKGPGRDRMMALEMASSVQTKAKHPGYGVLAVPVPSFDYTAEDWEKAVQEALQRSEEETRRILREFDEKDPALKGVPIPPRNEDPPPEPTKPNGSIRVKKLKPK